MNNLLLDEHPILVLPQLATCIGLNESIVLQQIHYWIKQNEKNNRNFKGDHYWTYNTFEEWAKQFPFWSMPTIKRIFKKLEDGDLLLVGYYNKKSYDRTKWYRINYKSLESLYSHHNIKVTQCIVSKRSNGKYQNDTKDNIKMIPTIPETNSETSSETNYIYVLFDYWNEKGIIKHRELTQARKSVTNARLKKYSVAEIKEAISNYKEILDSKSHYFTHKWNYEQFMKPSNLERFTDEGKPFDNFKDKSFKQTNEFVPMNDRYDPNKDLF